MLGLTDPTSGRVSVCGVNATTNPIGVKKRVGYLPDEVGFYDDRTALENLLYTARLNGIPDNEAKTKAEQLLARVGLSDALKKKTGKYSRGMRQRLGLADVLIKNPEVIILDEPTSGIDPNGVREFLDLIVELSREDGITVLFSSHHLHQVQQVCDRVGIFVGGKLLAEGNIQALSQQLFGNSPYVTEVGISSPEKAMMVEKLQRLLANIDGFKSVMQVGDLFHVDSAKDIAPLIARVLVNAGVELNHLARKEYGLDDIYYRYFEGGEKS